MKNNLKKSELLISPELGIYSNLYKDIYFDKYQGIKETQHNFLKANNLASRFKKSNKLKSDDFYLIFRFFLRFDPPWAPFWLDVGGFGPRFGRFLGSILEVSWSRFGSHPLLAPCGLVLGWFW